MELGKKFSMINLPSKGEFYKDGRKTLMVRYLTSVEEDILSDDLVMGSGVGMEMVLKNVIMDDIDVKTLVSGDFHSILIFLRATAFGDEVEISPTCPHCGKEAENSFRLSSLEFKEHKKTPMVNGSYIVGFEGLGIDMKITPMTVGRELESLKKTNENDFITFMENGVEKKILKNRTLQLMHSIDEINGKKDIGFIKNVINRLPRKYFEELDQFIKENQTGVQDYINLSCPYCGGEFRQVTGMGNNFLMLPYEYKEVIDEEIFLLTYYGKGFSYMDVVNMPTYLRKKYIKRVSREIEAKNEAEKREYNKAKSKNKR